MAHPAQQAFCQQVKQRFPDFFVGRRVLDVGALDVNGNNRGLFEDCQYTGIDIAAGRNVDVVTVAHEYQATDGTFDVVLSTEALEHDQFYPRTLNNMLRLVREEGLLFWTCATTGRAEHGTRRSRPEDSPLTSGVDPTWGDYYRNLTEDDIRTVWDVDACFESFQFTSDLSVCDLRFWGIKRSAKPAPARFGCC